jgi:hypothetical protein
MKNAEIKFSIVCCCYNSSGSIEALVKEFQCVFQEMKAAGYAVSNNDMIRDYKPASFEEPFVIKPSTGFRQDFSSSELEVGIEKERIRELSLGKCKLLKQTEMFTAKETMKPYQNSN